MEDAISRRHWSVRLHRAKTATRAFQLLAQADAAGMLAWDCDLERENEKTRKVTTALMTRRMNIFITIRAPSARAILFVTLRGVVCRSRRVRWERRHMVALSRDPALWKAANGFFEKIRDRAIELNLKILSGLAEEQRTSCAALN